MILGNKKFINAWNALDGIPTAVCIFKYEQGSPVIYYNYLLPMLLGYPEDKFKLVMSGGFMSIMDYEGKRHFSGWLKNYLDNPDDNDPIDIEYSVTGYNGEKKIFLQKCNFIYGIKGEKLFCCVITDITQQQQNERLLNLYSSMDSLTRIFNREAIQKDIENIIQTTKDDFQHAFIMLDIDDFRALNEKSGHDLCDLYLQRFGRVLLQPCKYGKTAGRIGGDEFALMLVGAKEETVCEAAEEVCKQIQSSFDEFTISIGISLCKNKNTTFDELYRQAFEALQEVKKNGKNGYRFYGDI